MNFFEFQKSIYQYNFVIAAVEDGLFFETLLHFVAEWVFETYFIYFSL